MTKQTQGLVITKKHLARLERERMQTRYILIGSVVVLALVVALVAYGVLNEYVFQPMQPVAEVAGDSISTQEFQATVRYRRYNLVSSYYQMVQYFGDDSSFRSQYESQLAVPAAMGQQVLESLIEDRIIRQEAARRGITVTKEEIDAALQADFGFYPNGTPSPTPTLPPVATSTLSALQETLTAPTATATPTTTVQATLAPTVTPTRLPTATADPNLPTATPRPTATPYTLDAFNQNFNEFTGSLDKEMSISESDLRKIYESELLRQKVLEAVTSEMNLTMEQEQVWARHILLPETSLITATQLLDQINNGADFAALAAEYSTDTGSAVEGGDLGWFAEGAMVAEFEQAAWSLQVGEVVSQPVKSQYGYHIIQVLGHEVRPLTDREFQNLRSQKFSEWLQTTRQELEAAGRIKKYDYWIDRIPSDPSLPASNTTDSVVLPTTSP